MHSIPVLNSDLRSDTVTRPTPAMREAMAQAAVGDDVLGEDPGVNQLQAYAAQLLGKEAALFVPSGTMANLLAVLSQTRPGDTVVMHEDAHPVQYESGNLAMLAGVMPRTTSGPLGKMTPDEVEPLLYQTNDHHVSNTTLVAIENTANRGGGSIYSLEEVRAIRALTQSRGIRLHCDGARLFNACVASGTSPKEYAQQVDSVSVCLSKGLGAPVGSLLLSDAETIDKAHRFRKMLGGGMRQAGFLAAAGLYALTHHVERLADDHRRAAQFRSALETCPGISFPMPSPTNIVYLDVPVLANEYAQLLKEKDVLVGVTGRHRMRVVFHLDVDDDGLQKAIDAFQSIHVN